jgi:hypothetical protein
MAKTQLSGARAAAPAFKEGTGLGVQQIDIVSNEDSGKTVSVVNSTMAFLYYESILQDSVRATVTFTDTGNTIEEKTAMAGLPIVGQETVNIKFTDNNENTINTTLFVNKVSPLLEDTTTSVVQLDLASREFIWNEKRRVNVRFDGKISDHVEKLLKDENFLGPTQKFKSLDGYTEKELDIEPTSNEHNFVGNNKKPYYIINWLSRGAVPESGSKGNTAGYFFWETSDKFYFKSIDTLMDTTQNKPKKSIIYNESPDAGGANIPEGYDYKALEYTVDNAVDIQQKLKLGAYSTRIITFDPFNCYYKCVTPNAGNSKIKGAANTPGDQKNLKLAGKKLPTLNPAFDIPEEGKEFSRTTYMVLDSGTLPAGTGEGESNEQLDKSKDENYNPGEVLNQGIMRMNQLFALKTTITIPGDFSLHAGDAIYVDAPELKTDTKNDEVDKQVGGNYIISDVCHYLSPKFTLTKLILVRDSFGRKPKERG